MESASPGDVASGGSSGSESSGSNASGQRSGRRSSAPSSSAPSSSTSSSPSGDVHGEHAGGGGEPAEQGRDATEPSAGEETTDASPIPGGTASLRPLNESVRVIWGLKYAGAWTVFLVAVFFYDLTHLFSSSWLPFGVMSGTVLLVGLLYSIFWPRLRYDRWAFDLRPEELYLEHGVVTNVRTIVPLRRIQHLDVSQDLLEREFGLGRLIVHTAGSRSSDVVIPGLRLDEAERIRDEVKRFILEDPLMEDPV